VKGDILSSSNSNNEKKNLRRSICFDDKNKNNLNLNHSQNDLVDLLSVRSMTYVQFLDFCL
jgi:hypothetical protein